MENKITFVKLTPRKSLIIELYNLNNRNANFDAFYKFYKSLNKVTIREIKEEIERIKWERNDEDNDDMKRLRELCVCGDCIHSKILRCNYETVDDSDDEELIL